MTTRKGSRIVELTLAACSLLGAGAAKAEAPVASAMPGAPVLALGTYDLATLGYVVTEFSVQGTAKSFKLTGAAGSDGDWRAVADQSAPYKTRIVVISPSDPSRFNGTCEHPGWTCQSASCQVSVRLRPCS